MLSSRKHLLIAFTICLFAVVIQQHVHCFEDDNEDDEYAHFRFRRASTALQCNYTYVPYTNSCDVCGTTNYAQNARIVGGSIATAYSWPAQVYIVTRVKGTYWIGGYLYNIDKSYVCGGTIINRYTIMTAGHCIITSFDQTIGSSTYTVNVNNPYDGSMYTVYVGAYDVSNLASYPTVAMSVRKVIRHPSFNEAYYLNDIALLLLSNPIDFNNYVQPACLPDPAYGTTAMPPTNSYVYASGWGTLSEGGSSPDKLYNVKLLAYASSSCANVEATFTKNWNGQICAGIFTGGKDTCQGDSGGGLYYYDTTYNKYVVVGVTSYGEGCARYGKPGIYTRTSYYYDWITSNWATTGDAARKLTNLNLVVSAVFVCIYKLVN